ncbi:type III secretion system gatekeeper subunit SctW [Sodalis ligni]|uniref:Type III secretion protein W n=1 Tax=Sodalis ligni TaxID=2697027 RepID=A0A4R1NJL6_9GAMM|nr:type III secretion system gatekeeper subunit SctW [Sodalis ligni]TCL06131.1 type III secretion protein W [Sodalis ligni]
MALSINNPMPQPAVYSNPAQSETKPHTVPTAAHDLAENLESEEAPVGQLLKFLQSSDEMSALASQFANRRLFDKKGESLSDGFERVLEEDAIPKAKSLLKVASVKEESLVNLLLYARSMFPDDSDLIMVLRELLRHKLSETLKKRLKALLDEVVAQANPRESKAGINCALKARLFSQKYLGLKPSLLRSSYRRYLQNEQHAIEDYKDWIACYGYQYRGVVLDFIKAALLTDIDSQDPSCSKLEFGDLIGKLSQVKLIRSGDELFIKKLMNNNTMAALNKSEPEWLMLFFSLLEYPEEIGNHLHILLGDRFMLTYHRERSAILQLLFQACKSLPHGLFHSAESAFRLLRDLQSFASIAYKHELIEDRIK